MGAFRKSLSLSVTLCLVLSSVPMISYADSSSPSCEKRTENAAKDTSFCTDTAPDTLKKLNEANEANMQKLEDLRQKVVGVTSEMEILNTMGAFRDQYLQGLNAIVSSSTQTEKVKKEENKLNNLGNLRKVIRNGLMLNAIGMLLKSSNLEKNDAFDISALCKLPSNESQRETKLICSKEMFGLFNSHALDKTFANFKLAYKNVNDKNKPALKEDVQKILDSIPENISPTAVIGLLNTSAPSLSTILNSNVTETDLKKCLNEKSTAEVLQSCERLFPAINVDPSKAEGNFITQLNKKTNDAVAGMGGLSDVINEAIKSNMKSLNNQIKIHTQLNQTSFEAIGPKLKQITDDTSPKLKQLGAEQSRATQRELTLAGADQTLAPAENMKKRTNLEEKMARDNLGIARLFLPVKSDSTLSSEDKIATELKAKWESKCSPPKNDKDVEECLAQMKIINSNIANEKNKYKDRLKNLQSEMNKIATDDNFLKVETMKQFIAEKYLRTCAKNSDITVRDESIKFAISVDGLCYGGLPQNLMSFESLSNNVNNIFANTKFAKTVQAKSGQETIFNKNEMNSFTSACKGNSNSNISDACELVARENTCHVAVTERIQQTIQKEKPIVEDDKNWVRYDGNGGYTKIAKKSTLRVVGEGMLPAIPQMIPMFFANYQTRQNIDMLTNQALFQKQMLHSYDIYNSSPWMYNYNYFGGTAYGYGSPFSTTGTASTTTGVTSTAGFGF